MIDRVNLPKLTHHESPNQSARILERGQAPHLVVVHRPAGSYLGSIEWLCNPRAQASAHIITHSNEATQLVPWHRKAWHAMAFNSSSYGVEVDDNAWNNRDMAAFNRAARLVAFICHKTGIPPSWSRNPSHDAGVARHFDLGQAGGGHTDPTEDTKLWLFFMERVKMEHERGGFRPTYGIGSFARIK